jgi:D-3-phosphoglycerate dehydrogenase
MFILAINRKLVLLNDLMREGKWKELRTLNFSSLSGNILGIIGMGAIGSELAAIGNFFSMKVVGYDPYLPKEDLSRKGVVAVDWESLWKVSDIISIHIPLNSETQKMIGVKEFSLMKPGSILINTSRGGIVDEVAMAQALQERRLGAVGLDVFEEEPLNKNKRS